VLLYYFENDPWRASGGWRYHAGMRRRRVASGTLGWYVMVVVAAAAGCAAQPVVAAADARRVSELLAKPPGAGRVKVVGYVARLYFCPSCPAGAVCKPCIGDHVVISDDKHTLEPGDELGPSDVLVFGDRAALQRLKAGGR
jgi:hypothetical protein